MFEEVISQLKEEEGSKDKYYQFISERLYQLAKMKSAFPMMSALAELNDAEINLNSFPPEYNFVSRLIQEKDEKTINFLEKEFGLSPHDIEPWDEQTLKLRIKQFAIEHAQNEIKKVNFEEVKNAIQFDENITKLQKHNTSDSKRERIDEFIKAITQCNNLHELAIFLSPDYRTKYRGNDDKSLDLIEKANQLQMAICEKRHVIFGSNAETYLNNLAKKFSEKVDITMLLNAMTPAKVAAKPK